MIQMVMLLVKHHIRILLDLITLQCITMDRYEYGIDIMKEYEYPRRVN